MEVQASLGNHLAATSIPKRRILLDAAVLSTRGDFERILVHELFHFAWVRLSNETRWDWEALLRREFARRVKGELGWSAEWRKDRLTARDIQLRSPAWRRYICESFCDTAASYYAGVEMHGEFTLAARPRRARQDWFVRQIGPVVIL